MTNEELLKELNQGFSTAFIDSTTDTNLAYKPEFVRNSSNLGQKVLTVLDRELLTCESFDISVAFITKSGITPLLQTLKTLEQKNIPGRILTTDYLMFSEPEALKTLSKLKNISLKMYCTKGGPGFHTKGYIFESAGLFRILIGSANLTQSALTVNQEWNTKVVSLESGEFAQNVKAEFAQLWNSKDSLAFDTFYESYCTRYETIQKQRAIVRQEVIPALDAYKLEPNSMQVGFIENLKKLAQKGAHKGLLISATGTGKTYASAFGLRDALKPNGKILFIVHRKQILKQAMASYQQVFGTGKSVAMLTGEDQDFERIRRADMVFAMITMLSKKDILNQFEPDEFTDIVIDEVHHAAAKSYLDVLNHFKPDFWLGMTATPDRPSGGDIYGLFDHNIAYEIRLQQALENNLLCPFHYFGISDIAFDQHAVADKYIKKAAAGDFELFNRLTRDERVDFVIEQAKYYGYSGKRVKGLIFCSSVSEAKALSDKFNKRGLRTIALSGDDDDETRSKAMDRLTSDSRDDVLDYILTVNIFNEGVDLPEINQVIMLRPTESAIVFIQQLGRGLRKFNNKEFVVILDFIGNYSNNFLIPIALSGDRTYNKDNIRKYLMEGASIIPGCSTIHFDEVSKQQIYAAINNAKTPLQFLKEKYFNLKKRLGRMPTMEEFYQLGEIDPILFVNYKKESYYSFVKRFDTEAMLPDITFIQERNLNFISTQIANGKRPHELIMLQELFEHGSVDEDSVKARLKDYDIVFRESDYRSAARFINASFLNSKADIDNYGQVRFFNEQSKSDKAKRKLELYRNVFDAENSLDLKYQEMVKDILSYGMDRFNDNFRKVDEDNLVLYQKYSRRDICRILNWDKDDSSIIFGYRIKHNTCPIFVTYEKRPDIPDSTKYEDVFDDQQIFSWMTRSKLTLKSKEVLSLKNYKNNNLKVFLFVKKNDDEGTDFYYMGRVDPENPTQKTIKGKHNEDLPIVNFKLRLKTPVRNDIYDYFVK